MTKALPLPARQVTALCRGAAKAGFVAEVKIGDVVVRLIPAANSQAARVIDDNPNPETFETWEEYQAWRDGIHARENQGRS